MFQCPNLSKEARRRLAVMDYYRVTKNAALACRHFGIPRATFYRWKSKYQPYRLLSLEPRKRGRRRGQTKIPWEQELSLVSWRKQHPSKGHHYCWQVLRPPCAPHTIYLVWQRHGLVSRKQRRKQPYQPLPTLPGYFQLDTKFLPGKRYQYTALEVHSRWRYLWMAGRLCEGSTLLFLRRFLQAYPGKIHGIQTDQGLEFQGRVREFLQERGIRHQYTHVRSPDQNGKVERSHRTDEEEFYRSFSPEVHPIPECNQRLRQWQEEYNTRRLHYALNWRTPQSVMEKCLIIN